MRITVLQSPIGRADGAIPRRADRHAVLALSTAARSDGDHPDRLNGRLECSMCLLLAHKLHQSPALARDPLAIRTK